jgi:hypothetical protein
MRGYDRLGRGGLLAGLGHTSASVAEAFSFQAATSQTPHLVGLATLRTAVVLGVDVDDVADRDNGATVGAGLSVGGRRSFGGHASHIAPRLSSEVAANPFTGTDPQSKQIVENSGDLRYSLRKACIGSVAAARRAGSQEASKTTTKRRSGTRQSITGSYQSVR